MFASLKLEVDVGVASFSNLTQVLKDSWGHASEEVKHKQWLKVDTVCILEEQITGSLFKSRCTGLGWFEG